MVEKCCSWDACRNTSAAREKIQFAKQKMSKCPHPGASSASYSSLGKATAAYAHKWHDRRPRARPFQEEPVFSFLWSSTAKIFLTFSDRRPSGGQGTGTPSWIENKKNEKSLDLDQLDFRLQRNEAIKTQPYRYNIKISMHSSAIEGGGDTEPLSYCCISEKLIERAALMSAAVGYMSRLDPAFMRQNAKQLDSALWILL